MTQIDATAPRHHPRARLRSRWVIALAAGVVFAVVYYGLLLAGAVWAAVQLFGLL